MARFVTILGDGTGWDDEECKKIAVELFEILKKHSLSLQQANLVLSELKDILPAKATL